MLPIAVPGAILPTLYPGHKYLLDLGSGKWSSGSLPWLTEKYAARGIEFDVIFGARVSVQGLMVRPIVERNLRSQVPSFVRRATF